MMGVWYLSISLGNLAGASGRPLRHVPAAALFGAVSLTVALAGIVLLLLVPAIKRLMGQVN